MDDREGVLCGTAGEEREGSHKVGFGVLWTAPQVSFKLISTVMTCSKRHEEPAGAGRVCDLPGSGRHCSSYSGG